MIPHGSMNVIVDRLGSLCHEECDLSVYRFLVADNFTQGTLKGKFVLFPVSSPPAAPYPEWLCFRCMLLMPTQAKNTN